MLGGSYINTLCHWRRVLSPTTLAPYASAVSNLLVKLEIASGKELERSSQ